MKKILDFIVLLNSDEKKSIVGPKLLSIYRDLDPTDKEELRELIELSPYPEIPELINLFGQLIGNYSYNEMRAGLWLRKYLLKKYRYKCFRVDCGKFKSHQIAKVLFGSRYVNYLPSARKELDLGLPFNRQKLKQFDRWCNLVALDPNHSYTIRAYSDGDLYSYTSNFYIEIFKTDYHG